MSEARGAVLAPGERVTVRGSTPDGNAWWSFAAETIGDDGDQIVLRVRAGEPVDGPEPWSWPADGRHHLWRSRPYSVLTTRRAGRFPYWYCTVHSPPAPAGTTIAVIDLGVAVQLFADGRYSVSGADDLSGGSAAAAKSAVGEIVDLIKRKAPPFDAVGAI